MWSGKKPVTGSQVKKRVPKGKPRAGEKRGARGSIPRAKAPWPDQSARRQMSQTEAECENLGKHSKNREWTKRW
jgi:hypothetical protein